MKGGHLKKETEAMVCAAHEQALRGNSIKNHIDGQDLSPMSRLCGETSETVMYLSSGFPVLAKSKYRSRHDIVGKHIHWLLLKKHEIPTENKWYSHETNVATETDDGKVTIYWDKPIKTDGKGSYNRPDVVVIGREENTGYIVDFAIPMDHHIKEKEEEKIDKYMDLQDEVRRQFRVKIVIVPIVLGALGTVPETLSKSLEKLEIDDIIGILETAVLTSTTAILRRVLNL